MNTRYQIHGVSVSVRVDLATVEQSIHSRLRLFPESAEEGSELLIEYRQVASGEALIPRPDGESRPLWEIPGYEFAYLPGSDQLYLARPDVIAVLCDPEKGTAACSFRPEDPRASWLASHPMFTVPLVEMLKRRGLFAVHAAAVSVDGKGVLFPGASGAGKSTLTLALVRAGLEFLADDTVFLRHDAAGLRVHAFPDEIDLTEATMRMFPELASVANTKREPGWPKHRVWPETLYPLKIAWSCPPAALVFPQVTNAAQSRVEPMGRDEALIELLSNVPLTDRGSSQAHLDALAELARACDCFRLWTGRDVDALPTLVRQIVSGDGAHLIRSDAIGSDRLASDAHRT